ncbi:uncharacterized protein [Prorops nasuta]|uniref:uncharacterized protein n=1 Tax=Prorops nasuta TaxID=863751 RepID=UPI0034CDDDBC
MSDEIRLSIQKRASLKTQITTVSNLLDKGKIDNATLKLRIARITALFHAFEESNDELIIADPGSGHVVEAISITEKFYTLAGRAENILGGTNLSERCSVASGGGSQNNIDTNLCTLKRKIKLPTAPLPTFDGNYENWLNFKNTFNNLIGNNSELSDMDKFYYLKSALTGEAENKLKIFSVDGMNYAKAWELLEKAYQVKRVLISRHLSLMMKVPNLENETSIGLSKLADEMQQNVASLKTLGVDINSEIIVHILENKLPKNTLERWEQTLSRDEFPTADLMYEFLYRTAVCASKRERARKSDTHRDKHEFQTKKRKVTSSNNQTFLANVDKKCVACKEETHPLFMCKKFKQLPVDKRIELVKIAKLCYNCMRSHLGKECKFSACKICGKRHNSLLHFDSRSNTQITTQIPTKSDVANEKSD